MSLLGRTARDAMARLMHPAAGHGGDCPDLCPCRIPVGDDSDDTKDDDDA